jgi:hypothetical protein
MSSSPESAKRDNAAILDKHTDLFQNRNVWEKARAEIAERVGRAYLREGSLSMAREEFEESLRLDATSQRRLLYLLTFTHPAIIGKLRSLKRQRSIQKSSCTGVSITNGVVSAEESTPT